MEHLYDQAGDEGIRTLLRAYADGATDEQAFARAFGTSIDDIEASFKTFVTERYGALADAMKDPPMQVDPRDLDMLKMRAGSATGNFVSQLALGQALVKAGDDADAQRPLERAAALAPPASGDASPHALLAQIAIRAGDADTARTELRALLKYDHTNVNAARRLAALASTATATDDETYALRLVADLDPFDATTHTELGKRELDQSRQQASVEEVRGHQEAALIEFRAALALSPANLAEAHANAAEVLLALDRKDEAKREAILALQQAPTYARAQDLLLAAIGR